MDNNQQPVFIEPQIPSQPIGSKPSKDRRSNRVLLIIAIVSSLIAIILAVLLAIALVQSQTLTNKLSSQTNIASQNDTDSSGPNNIISKIQNSYASKYSLVDMDSNSQPQANQISIRLRQTPPPYKADGYNFFNYYDGGSSVYLLTSEDPLSDGTLPKPLDVKIRQEITDIFMDSGLIKTSTWGDVENEIEVFVSKDLVCTIESPTNISNITSASCGELGQYPTVAEQIKPFANSYPNLNSSTVFGLPKITDSSVAGYQRAEITVSSTSGPGSAVLLYYKNQSDQWTFFSGTQEALSCSAYNTADTKNAFKGVACYDDNSDQLTKL